MVGRVVMKAVVLGLAFCSIAEGRSSSSSRSRGGDSGDTGGGGGGGGDVFVKLNGKQMCLGFNPTTTTTINTTTSTTTTTYTINTTTSITVGKATLGTITSPDIPGLVDCQWVIVNPKRKNVLLSFTQFNLRAGHCINNSTKCCYQWLIVNPNTPTPRRRWGWWQLGHYHNPYHNTHLSHNGGGSGGGGDVLGAGKVCGAAIPPPVVTQAPRVYVSYYLSAYAKSMLAPLAPSSSPGTGGGGGTVGNASTGFTLEFYAASNSSVCGADEFPCHSPHLCVPLTWLCDGKVHCPDHSDENTCRGGQAVQLKRQKKKKKQQEKEKEKNESKNRTVESSCLQEATTIQCDGAWQCPNGEDEKGCPGCGPDEWWCGMGRQCYSASQRCDGTPHCINSMDELSCNPRCHRRVSCWGWGCYMLSQRCDGSPDCGDASDEAGCSPELCNAQHGTFLCNNRRCIRETWRCDQLDDCRDGSDEQDCLRNSVIGVAAMGGLACSLLLVVAVGCTGRLYALRMGLTRMQGSGSRARSGGGGVRGGGGPAGSSHTPRSRLEEHLMQREMPPPYDVAVSDHSTPLFGTCMDWQHWRWQRRRTSAPRDGANIPNRVPADPHHPCFHHHSSPTTQGLAVEIQPGGRREGVEEKVEERGGGDENRSSASAFLFPSMHEGDVPLLTALVGGEGEGEGEEGDDVPLLLDITSTSSTTTSSSTSSICEGESDQEEEELGSACSRGVGSDGDEEDEDEDEEEEEEGDKGMGKAITLPLLPDLLHLTPQPLTTPHQPPTTHTQDKTTGEAVGMGRREYISSPASPFVPKAVEVNREKEEEDKTNLSFPSSPSSSSSSSFPPEVGGEGGEGGGDVLSSDTRAAVLALSAVQTHLNEMGNSDTEMICQ